MALYYLDVLPEDKKYLWVEAIKLSKHQMNAGHHVAKFYTGVNVPSPGPSQSLLLGQASSAQIFGSSRLSAHKKPDLGKIYEGFLNTSRNKISLGNTVFAILQQENKKKQYSYQILQ